MQITPLKKAMLISATVHAVIIGAILIGEAIASAQNIDTKGIVFLPAAPKGDLPIGLGRGAGEAPAGNNPQVSSPRSGGPATTPSRNVSPAPAPVEPTRSAAQT